VEGTLSVLSAQIGAGIKKVYDPWYFSGSLGILMKNNDVQYETFWFQYTSRECSVFIFSSYGLWGVSGQQIWARGYQFRRISCDLSDTNSKGNENSGRFTFVSHYNINPKKKKSLAPKSFRWHIGWKLVVFHCTDSFGSVASDHKSPNCVWWDK